MNTLEEVLAPVEPQPDFGFSQDLSVDNASYLSLVLANRTNKDTLHRLASHRITNLSMSHKASRNAFEQIFYSSDDLAALNEGIVLYEGLLHAVQIKPRVLLASTIKSIDTRLSGPSFREGDFYTYFESSISSIEPAMRNTLVTLSELADYYRLPGPMVVMGATIARQIHIDSLLLPPSSPHATTHNDPTLL